MNKRISLHPLGGKRHSWFVIKKVILRESMNFVSLDGLYMEFGVAGGFSIRYIAKLNPEKTIYGFDTFTGLPEDWHIIDQGTVPKGTFSQGGNLPKVPQNVKLVPGLFEESLPEFTKTLPDGPVAFIHIDCDLYSSTKTIFKYLGSRIVPGTVIVFDEYNMNAIGEKEAFAEWLEESNLYAALLRETSELKSFQASFLIHDGNTSFDTSDAINYWSPDNGTAPRVKK